MIREILTYPDKRLSLPCKEILEITDTLRELAADMLETMYHAEGIGLAAPQVGVHQRMIVVDISGPEQRENPCVYINPRLELLDGTLETEEGCLSVPALRSKVTRTENVRLHAMDLDGNPVSFVAEGLLSVCLQHEIDHLDGKLFIDRISRLKRSLYDSKVKKWQKRNRE